MAEPLKNQFGEDIARKIAVMTAAVHPEFDSGAFLCEALEGYARLDLMARGRKIAAALRSHLPPDYAEATEILIASFGPRTELTQGWGMAPFLYLPHSFFIAQFGLGHFALSMRAQYELTQRFTAEFSIRPYLEHHRDATLDMLKGWARDPSVHVRRLVSEGTRPRLPWAPRLRDFQTDPRPVLELLELMRDDPEPYVRRSVANNLNDIGKDHPDILLDTAQRWLEDAPLERQRLIRHALRTAVKSGDSRALALLGFGEKVLIGISNIEMTPQQAIVGEAVRIAFDLVNPTSAPQRVLADLKVFYPKANGQLGPKVFRLKSLELAPGATLRLQKTVSFAPMTTRRHYPGTHRVEVLLNGTAYALGEFELT